MKPYTPKQKKTLMIIGAVLAFFVLFAIIDKKPEEKTTTSDYVETVSDKSDYVADSVKPTEKNVSSETKDNKKLIEVIKQQKKILDYVITDANVLYATVVDDGTVRNGYATYLCQEVKDANSSVTRVKIIKYGSQNDPNKDNAYGVLLGECYCNF
jgi:hypothetical protein